MLPPPRRSEPAFEPRSLAPRSEPEPDGVPAADGEDDGAAPPRDVSLGFVALPLEGWLRPEAPAAGWSLGFAAPALEGVGDVLLAPPAGCVGELAPVLG